MKTDLKEALRYMGVKGAPDPSVLALAKQAEEEVNAHAKVRSVFKKVEIKADESAGYVEIVGAGVRWEGKNLPRHLSGCESAYLIAATLGFEMEKRVNYLMSTRPALGVATDAACTSALECFLDERCAQLERECGKKLKPRFSCGYGDYPIDLQGEFLRILDAPRKIGLCTNKSSLLTPTKSVTAVMGISKNPIEKRKRGCAVCNMRENCKFRKAGLRCDI